MLLPLMLSLAQTCSFNLEMINQNFISLFFFSNSKKDEYKLPKFCPQTQLLGPHARRRLAFPSRSCSSSRGRKKPFKIILLFKN